MSGLDIQNNGPIFTLTLSRPDCHNAFDDNLLKAIYEAMMSVKDSPSTRCVVIQATGKHFCAGADLNWMQRMAQFSEVENHKDAMILADAMQAIYHCPVPTICLVQGAAMGGGAGIAAASDITIATDTARFCFSEAKLGLIPAVISPYVVEAIGPRAAKQLFCTAEIFNANRAYELGLAQQIVTADELKPSGKVLCDRIINNAPEAVQACKSLVDTVKFQNIDDALLNQTANLIASKRVGKEGQMGLQAFLNKTSPNWSDL